jgi:uncharacterized protein (TIGR02145 family)
MLKKQWQILAMLPFLFPGCNRDALRDDAGKWASVRIRMVNVAEGAPNEIGTRASGGSEKRMTGGPIVQDLGGGVFAEITVEEEASALRTDPARHALASGSKFRVIALDGNNKVYSYADYTTPAFSPSPSGVIDPDAGSEPLQVRSGESYRFVCISYNCSDLPDKPEKGKRLAPVSLSTANDLLWESKLLPSISGSLDLSFDKLTHRLAIVQLVIENPSAGGSITTVSDTGIRLGEVATGVGFDLVAGGASSVTATASPAFGGWDEGQQMRTSDWISFFPQTTGNYTLSVSSGAVGLSGSETTPAASISIPCAGFTAGSSYRIRLRLAPCGKGGVANSLKIGNGKYLTHVYGSGSSRRCWMVENSMEGSAAFTSGHVLADVNGNEFLQQDGYYYTYAQSIAPGNACPAGWRIPNAAEAGVLLTEVLGDKAGVGQWWFSEGAGRVFGNTDPSTGASAWGNDVDGYHWVQAADAAKVGNLIFKVLSNEGRYEEVTPPSALSQTVRCVHE